MSVSRALLVPWFLLLFTDRRKDAEKSGGEGTDQTGGGEGGAEAGRAEGPHPEGVRGRAGEEEEERDGGEEAKQQV